MVPKRAWESCLPASTHQSEEPCQQGVAVAKSSKHVSCNVTALRHANAMITSCTQRKPRSTEENPCSLSQNTWRARPAAFVMIIQRNGWTQKHCCCSTLIQKCENNGGAPATRKAATSFKDLEKRKATMPASGSASTKRASRGGKAAHPRTIADHQPEKIGNPWRTRIAVGWDRLDCDGETAVSSAGRTGIRCRWNSEKSRHHLGSNMLR